MNLEKFNESWSFLSKSTVYVGCSGGVDSVVLVHLLHKIGADVQVIHVNYSLRGNDSEKDAQFVRALCHTLNIPIYVKKIDTKALLEEQGGNLQEVARGIRYAVFEEKLATNPSSYIALGHHSDDQVETFFQHLARKSGVLGLACMLPIHNSYVRPLLMFSKEDIRAYAIANQLAWREDVSNSENKYTRNRLRNILLPHLYSEIPSIKDSVLTLVNAFQETQKYNSQVAGKIIEGFLENRVWVYSNFDGLSEDIRLEVVRHFGGDYSVYIQLLKIRNAQKGKWVICGSYRIYKETIGFSFVISTKEIKYTLKKERVTSLPLEFTKEIIYLDASKLVGDLKVRTWEQGDRIAPLGMKGSKLISDVLTEAKVFSSDREACLVVVDTCSVLWCVGYKVSRKAIADMNCQNILKVQIVEK